MFQSLTQVARVARLARTSSYGFYRPSPSLGTTVLPVHGFILSSNPHRTQSTKTGKQHSRARSHNSKDVEEEDTRTGSDRFMDGFMEYVSSDTWARIGRRIEKEAEAAVDAASDDSPLWTMFNEEPRKGRRVRRSRFTGKQGSVSNDLNKVQKSAAPQLQSSNSPLLKHQDTDTKSASQMPVASDPLPRLDSPDTTKNVQYSSLHKGRRNTKGALERARVIEALVNYKSSRIINQSPWMWDGWEWPEDPHIALQQKQSQMD